ncbi:DUF5053 domain-containing protein [Parabacteroides pacaensis]|uniref:DUF5053 domain-containing protein n=1 Tax=Parabacteroides pacaensis TaxID=2086575 RepID=UPI000D0F01EB|nr:DUF5053 domain-containing protein [Parabacteroides pacaensis]
MELIDKIFPSAEMKAEFQQYESLQTDGQREAFFSDLQSKFASESKEEHAERVNKALEAGQNAVEELHSLIILKQLESVSPYISLAEISRKYFGKSRGWLSQRLHENPVRGKIMKLKPDEVKTLQTALIDIADKLRNTAMSLSFT